METVIDFHYDRLESAGSESFVMRKVSVDGKLKTEVTVKYGDLYVVQFGNEYLEMYAKYSK